jgi:predicted metal-dependent hydrolase
MAAMKCYTISNNDQCIHYQVIHRPAVTRRIHLEINSEGDLQVVAPRRMSRRAIQMTLQKRVHHVARFLARARAQRQDLQDYRYINGEEHLFMGRRCPLDVVAGKSKRGTIDLVDGRIQVQAPDCSGARVKSVLENWYRLQAQKTFTERLTAYSQLAPWVETAPPPMRLRRMKRTWGSCSSKGVITLNPHLVKAPPECIDYVIAHEICHLCEHNHGKAFYSLQEQLFPDWRKEKAHLQNKGHIYLHT